ncbi:hypothetical protein WJX73_010347 [Symbiochloris irregularis]|uniref:Uncharacterized protein n=1 Tax=Symbiochloris irregularis TaxID=706552 RepID=A0AAW1PTZ9_9CHLO
MILAPNRPPQQAGCLASAYRRSVQLQLNFHAVRQALSGARSQFSRNLAASATTAASRPKSETFDLSTQDKELVEAKSALLLEILTSGRQVEQKLAQHASQVDAVMLRLLERRIDTAHKSKEEEKHIQGLQILYKRMKLLVDRSSANPVELLLDDLLTRMAQKDWTASEDQKQELKEVMRAAFGLPEEEVNIFGLASDISPGDDSESDDFDEEEAYGQQSSTSDADVADELPIVPMPQFSKESRALLKGVLKDCVDLRKALDSGEYAHAAPVLHEKLQERVVLAKQMELIIRTADQLTSGISLGLDTFTPVDQLPDQDEDEDGA